MVPLLCDSVLQMVCLCASWTGNESRNCESVYVTFKLTFFSGDMNVIL